MNSAIGRSSLYATGLGNSPEGLARRACQAWSVVGRLHAAGFSASPDAELAHQLRLVEVQVEAGDLALVDFVDAAEAHVRAPAGRGDLTGRPTEGAGVRAGGATLVHTAPVVGVDSDDLQPVVRERLVVHVPDRLGGFPPGQPRSARRLDFQPVQVK